MTWWKRMLHLVRERTRQETKELAAQAMVWTDDETLNTALARMRYDIVESWRLSKDPTTRERTWIALHTVDVFAGQLTKMLADEEVLKEQETRAKRSREAGL